jgi:hypothetical protein
MRPLPHRQIVPCASLPAALLHLGLEALTDDLLHRGELARSARSRPSAAGEDGMIRACTASGEYAKIVCRNKEL